MTIFDLVGTAFLSNYKFFITATIVKKKRLYEMVESENILDNYKTLKISIRAIIKNPWILKSFLITLKLKIWAKMELRSLCL